MTKQKDNTFDFHSLGEVWLSFQFSFVQNFRVLFGFVWLEGKRCILTILYFCVKSILEISKVRCPLCEISLIGFYSAKCLLFFGEFVHRTATPINGHSIWHFLDYIML